MDRVAKYYTPHLGPTQIWETLFCRVRIFFLIQKQKTIRSGEKICRCFVYFNWSGRDFPGDNRRCSTYHWKKFRFAVACCSLTIWNYKPIFNTPGSSGWVLNAKKILLESSSNWCIDWLSQQLKDSCKLCIQFLQRTMGPFQASDVASASVLGAAWS